MNAIIIQYDKRPNATIDEKLQSLIESIQLALNGMGDQDYAYQTSQNKGMDAVLAAVRQVEEALSTVTSSIGGLGDRLDTAEGSISTLEDTTIPGIQDDISGLDGRLDTLEGTIPAAPNVDGTYKLTVTVTSGLPAYTWELVV